MLVNFDSLKTFYNALKQKMKNYRGNWNQNDPTADDYIKNRPFYSEGVKEIEILPKTTLNCPSYYGMDDPFKIKLITGTEYTVVFDGATYKCVAKETYEDEPFIGNSSILGWNDNTNTGEPFFIDVCYYDNGESEVTFATTKDGTHTISVSIVEEIVHKLDKKFVPIPDDVVSEDDLADVAFSGDYNDLYNTPTIYDDVVRYGITQSLSEAQKSIARENIGAGDGNYNNLINKPTIYTDVVRYNNADNLTSSQKLQARTNIGAGTSNFSGSYNDLNNIPTDHIVYADNLHLPFSAKTIACYGNDRFVAYGNRGETAYSLNGIKWTSGNGIGTSATSNYLTNSICYGNDIFVATGYNSAYYSQDGISWTYAGSLPKNGSTSAIYSTVTFCNDKFIVAGDILAYSLDGKTWTQCTVNSLSTTDPMWRNVCYGNGKYVAMGVNRAAYSDDGITWTAVTKPSTGGTRGAQWVCYGNNRFIATPMQTMWGDHAYLYSEDGITWTKQDSEICGPIYYDNEKFIVVSSMKSKYSYDGINWFDGNMPFAFDFGSICYNGSVYIATPYDTPLSNQYAISQDGINWMEECLIDSNNVLTKEIAETIGEYLINNNIVPDVSDIPEAASPMVGATSTTDGTTGTVPAPTSTDSTKFLRGDGTWADVSSSCPIESGVTDILPDKYYTFGTVDSLTINLVDTGDDSKLCEYCFEFIPSENFTGLTITPEPKWAHTIRFIPGMTCQVSILRGIGVMLCA